ncbi:hypothetical protein [Sinorhizobium meliloti]|uniref:hypothetical protein n=1 Tax=Rhizobium meliloti TaxID=382 RepID=UPI000FDABEFA|nr:hypothetical protein [Sinorhizobium meliloti]RVG92103.1 hypothetical protein CN218_18655 [Sinorhizobium meliloti]
MPAPKSPISSTDLRQQKKGAEARLEALRQEQVDAIEEGSDLPHNNEILVVNERLAALDKAIARAERREAAEEARRERAEQRDEVRRQQEALQTSEQVYLDLLADAEKATGELVRLLRSVDAHSRELYRIGIGARDFLRRHGQPSDEPNELSGPNLSDRLGSYLSSTLCDIRRGTNAPDRLGMVTWQNVAPMNTSWAEAEKRALAGNRNQKLRVLDRVLVALQESPDEAE